MVSVVARLDGGEYLSLLVDLNAPRERPTLRVAPGLVSYDGERLFQYQPRSRLDPGGRIVHELLVKDLLRNKEFTVIADASGMPGDQLDVVHLRERSALLRLMPDAGDPRWWEVKLFSGELRELEVAEAVQRFERFGPDRGFAVYLDQGNLVLGLPRDGTGEAVPLLDAVDGIVAVHWIAEEYFRGASLDVLESRFKMAGAVVARAQECAVDGDLSEWSGDEALAVSTDSHVARGAAAWDGPRDASFALAARLAPHELCLAVRVRDDHLVPGADAVIIHADERSWQLPVPAHPEPLEQQGVRAAFTDQAAFGIGVELCMDPSVWRVHEGHVPLRVLYRDQDPGQELCVLASAPDIPWPALAGVRLPRRGREGALPRRE